MSDGDCMHGGKQSKSHIWSKSDQESKSHTWSEVSIHGTGMHRVCMSDGDCMHGGKCHLSGLVCLCVGDYIGDVCEMDLMTAQVYMPEIPPHMHPAR